MFVILMGAQGSGKGTQAALLGPKHNLVRLSTGDLFRAAIAAKSELGLRVKGLLDAGQLVPDEVTNPLVEQRLADIDRQMRSGELGGVIFDGYPRTAGQAAALDTMLADHGRKIDAVFEIDVPRDILIERLAGRRVCENCGTNYHIATNPTLVDGVCDKCGGKVVQRDDDKPGPIAVRLAAFDAQTAPLFDYYDRQGLLSTIDGNRAVEDVAADIDAVLGAAGAA
jgi:adenylate kinase